MPKQGGLQIYLTNDIGSKNLESNKYLILRQYL